MARLPEDLINRIKKEVPLTELCREYGIKLIGSGKNVLGKCPLHEDDTPSFVVTPEKNLWNCLAGCGGGDNIKLVMEMEKLSFRHAAEKLAARLGIVTESQTIKTSRGRAYEILVKDVESVDNDKLLAEVVEFYHSTFLNQPQAIKYLQERCCFHPEAVKTFKIGYANRTLGYRVPANTKAGKELKERLTELGVYGRKGHEHLNGSVVFPIFDREGNVVQLYGRKVTKKLRTGTPLHLYLEGAKRGIWNLEGIKEAKEWLLCESIIDALTLWSLGFKNATCAFGVNGLNEDFWQQLEETKPERILICYDNDKAGNKAANALKDKLGKLNIDALRLKIPEGMDTNRYAVENSEALCTAVKEALSSTKIAANLVADPALCSKSAVAATPSAPQLEKVAKEKRSLPPLELKGEYYELNLGTRVYRIGGLQKNNSHEVLRITLRVMSEDLMHVDSLDLYKDSERRKFLERAVEETLLDKEILKRDLGKLLLELEKAQEERLSGDAEEAEIAPLSEEEEREASEFLGSPHLLDRIAQSYDAAGLVGESTNKLAAYLACVSRKLRRPLAIIIQSTSAAGKSTLMEAVLSFFPQEEQIKYSAMTGQSLYYLGETNLKHKILAIVEEEGAEKASYALKLLQSEGELTIASTGKDATTGRMETQEYHVEGPVAIVFTTTSIDIDEELMNRCLVLTVDESKEQTEKIHELQRLARTPEGIIAAEQRKAVVKLMQNAQRLIKPMKIANPYAKYLTFTSGRTRTRRDHEKYLTLIDTIALLHQHQRELVKHKVGERIIEMLPVTLEDIEAANKIAPEVLGRSLDELPPQTRRLLEHVQELVKAKLEATPGLEQQACLFSRKELRELSGWSQTQIHRHLDCLVDLEYVRQQGGKNGVRMKYELLVNVDEKHSYTIGLIDVEKLRTKGKKKAS